MIIGLDVGGTHTDVVLLGDKGLLRQVKVLTDPADLFSSVLQGLEKITENINPAQIRRAVLSTTITTNVIVQKQFPKVGMIVSGGPGIDPELFRTNPYYFSVTGSIDHRGREIAPVDPDEIKSLIPVFKQEDIQHVGVVGKFSMRNPSHEFKIEKILKDSFDRVFLGHTVSGNFNFPRRIETTYLNTVIYPIHKKFYAAVKKSLEKKGLMIPIHILKADGGTMSFEASMESPHQTLLSGPAASVMGAIGFAPEEDECLVLDIGGTTTDMAILINRVPLLNPLGITLGNIKTLIRALETRSIGIGGDSAVRVVDGGLDIGPERCGPAMAYGGSVPTPTDALFAMGMITDGDTARAREGIKVIAAQLGLSLEAAAFDIFDLTCRTILDEAQGMVNFVNSKPVYTIHEFKEGYQVKPKKVLVLGGPAPYFVEHLKKLSGFQVDLVPKWQVANAIGAALARTTCEVILFADTEQGTVLAPGEGYSGTVNGNFLKTDAVKKAFELLRKKALQQGADAEDLEVEIIEEQQFNMIRGFSTTGRNIRVKVQVKPGLIHGYESCIGTL
ncbi:MAG: hydantoinase/oxoprolinase family protein [Desulfobacterales bacterium]|nr:hydantoinase/oxoprolinase family protein [Desulfobacterales bacterium]